MRALITAARTDFSVYIQLFRPPVPEEDRTPDDFVFSKLHQFLAQRVQDVADLKIGRRQVVSVPPQHGKSTILSIEATSWVLGRFPGIQAAITGFSPELVTEFSKAIRDRVQHPLYHAVFPDCDIVHGSNRMDNWRLTNGSTLRAKSTQQKLTGRRVDWLIIDDPHSGRDDAESPTERARIKRWYDADCLSRLSPGSAVFIIATRWHPEDLIGQLTNSEHVASLTAAGRLDRIYDVVNLPAICDDEDNDPLGRKNGEAAFPEVRNIDFLLGTKAEMEAAHLSFEWDSQFMGRPVASGAGQADTSKIIYIDLKDVPDDLELVIGWDLALTEKQSSDYTVAALCAYDWKQDIFYLVDLFRNRKRWVANRKMLVEKARLWREQYPAQVNRLGIEAVAGFGVAFAEIHEELLGEFRVTVQNPPRGGKVLRAQPWINKMDARRFRMVRGAWNKDFTTEVQTLGAGDHDDPEE